MITPFNLLQEESLILLMGHAGELVKINLINWLKTIEFGLVLMEITYRD